MLSAMLTRSLCFTTSHVLLWNCPFSFSYDMLCRQIWVVRRMKGRGRRNWNQEFLRWAPPTVVDLKSRLNYNAHLQCPHRNLNPPRAEGFYGRHHGSQKRCDVDATTQHPPAAAQWRLGSAESTRLTVPQVTATLHRPWPGQLAVFRRAGHAHCRGMVPKWQVLFSTEFRSSYRNL